MYSKFEHFTVTQFNFADVKHTLPLIDTKVCYAYGVLYTSYSCIGTEL